MERTEDRLGAALDRFRADMADFRADMADLRTDFAKQNAEGADRMATAMERMATSRWWQTAVMIAVVALVGTVVSGIPMIPEIVALLAK